MTEKEKNFLTAYNNYVCAEFGIEEETNLSHDMGLLYTDTDYETKTGESVSFDVQIYCDPIDLKITYWIDGENYKVAEENYDSLEELTDIVSCSGFDGWYFDINVHAENYLNEHQEILENF